MIETITADGRRLTPVAVFIGASLQGQWYSDIWKDDSVLRNWKYDHSPTGFFNAEIALKWFKEVYLLEIKPENAL